MKDTDDMRECFDNLDVEIKLCKDCKYRRFSFLCIMHLCTRALPNDASTKPCFLEREEDYESFACGASAKYFERKQTLLERVKGWLK